MADQLQKRTTAHEEAELLDFLHSSEETGSAAFTLRRILFQRDLLMAVAQRAVSVVARRRELGFAIADGDLVEALAEIARGQHV